MQELTGKVAVVTGGASGIGRALAHRFAAEGMKLVVGDVEAPALDAVVAELRAAGAEVEGLPTDVSDAAQVQALADATIERFGAVHVVCNNAGVGSGGFTWEIPTSTWEWVLGVNLWGVVHGIRSFVPLLVAQGEPAHVVNTASVAGLVAAPFMSPYNASKHAVVGITETLYHELAVAAPHVGVSVVCPGWVDTRIGESERNRPAHLEVPVADEEGAEAMAKILQDLLAAGIPPDVVADHVVGAIRERRFWVLTHDDESDMWVAAVNNRLRSLAERTNPQTSMPA